MKDPAALSMALEQLMRQGADDTCEEYVKKSMAHHDKIMEECKDLLVRHTQEGLQDRIGPVTSAVAFLNGAVSLARTAVPKNVLEQTIALLMKEEIEDEPEKEEEPSIMAVWIGDDDVTNDGSFYGRLAKHAYRGDSVFLMYDKYGVIPEQFYDEGLVKRECVYQMTEKEFDAFKDDPKPFFEGRKDTFDADTWAGIERFFQQAHL